MRNIAELGTDVTLVVVAHRRSTLAICDRLLRLEGGAVSEIGSYTDLIGSKEQRPLVRTAI